MPDTRPQKKKPKWLTGEDTGALEPRSRPAGRQGPLAEDDMSEIRVAEHEAAERLVGSPRSDGDATAAVPRVTPTQTSGAAGGVSGGAQAGGQPNSGGNSQSKIIQRLRANPAPALLALLVLVVLAAFFWFVFLRGGGEANEAPADGRGGGGEAPLAAQPSPETGGVNETGIVFDGLDEGGDKASLQGAGLDWEGSITKKEGGAGETITLEGPTAAQIERGFEVDNSDVDSGVYALAQDDGSVVHVDTHTYQLVSQQQDEEADEQIEREITLGMIFDLKGGNLKQLGFYVDRHEAGSPKILRTYYRGPDFDPKDSYEVSFNGPKGTPVPLLVGYRDKGQESQQSKQGEE